MKSDLINIKSKLRESFALSPDAAIVTDDGRGCKVVAVDVAHQVIINVGLPRHFGLPVLILLLVFSVFRVLKAGYKSCAEAVGHKRSWCGILRFLIFSQLSILID